MTALKIDNRTARRLWLSAHGLAATPTGTIDLMGIIDDLGFVQLDSIQVIVRAHHHILWSRNQNYREPMLDRLMARERRVFEHFTHDASVLPMSTLPAWQRQFRRRREKIDNSGWYKSMPGPEGREKIKRRIAEEGPLCTRAFETKIAGKKEMWSRPPHKLALDYMWYAGELATSHREGFTKFYDLAERVFPAALMAQQMEDRDQVDWLCGAALERIGFGTLGEVRKFWDAADPGEVAGWAERADGLVEVEVQSADGSWTAALGSPDIEARVAGASAPTTRLRILNPFDPAIRDRVRLKRLFGFEYTVEMFVPEAKRRWGYYVFPLLEGDRFVGRIEAKADRGDGALRVSKLWWEPGVRLTPARGAKLEAELARLARLAGVDQVIWECALA